MEVRAGVELTAGRHHPRPIGRGLGGLGRWQVLMAAPIKPLLTAALMPLAQKP